MEVFRLRDKLIESYADYFRSFLKVADERIQAFLEDEILKGRKLWPEALIQLNPAYEPGPIIEESFGQGTLHPQCMIIFLDNRKSPPRPLRLYAHQYEAKEETSKGQSFIGTRGTGSDKNFTCWIPIFGHVHKHGSDEPEFDPSWSPQQMISLSLDVATMRHWNRSRSLLTTLTSPATRFGGSGRNGGSTRPRGRTTCSSASLTTKWSRAVSTTSRYRVGGSQWKHLN